ncbi:TIGR01841 family phasin [Paraburkholderia caledonica]|jgi:phasin family protein|uniref:TIGR01841 family phasin n=1 Tax=Paraburkholderia caledonica TaxID=134536 RepID=UPI000DEF82A9|nr:TIGR01841 family phasin [Paraburkholderia caledonica]AXF17475.1 chemotaxis protein [Paraburkholderia caledonica]
MATPFPQITDFSKMLESFKLPGVDMTSLLEARRKDVEALAEANTLAYEGMQALVRKQTEMLNASAREIQAAAGRMSGENPMESMAQRRDFVQQALKTAFENMRELAEMAQKSQTEALAAISKRAEQTMRELKAQSNRT